MIPDTHQFITVVIQQGKSKPVKYKHYLKIPIELYQELSDKGIVKPEHYFINQDAFFEFNFKYTIINFVSLYLVEDLHRKIDFYLINKLSGSYPLIRGISC
jgi:hypothetical protein